jgi:hypothetical protein
MMVNAATVSSIADAARGLTLENFCPGARSGDKCRLDLNGC